MKIGIIGGGIGGASASHYLNELFDGRLNIDLFEAKELGGRLATVEIAGMEYEAGGAIIHDKNLLMRNFVKLLGKTLKMKNSTITWQTACFIFMLKFS